MDNGSFAQWDFSVAKQPKLKLQFVYVLLQIISIFIILLVQRLLVQFQLVSILQCTPMQ